MGNWWGAEEDSNNVNTSTSTKGNITSQTLGGTVSSKPKYIYRHSDPRDPITLFSSHKSIEIFTKEEMKQLMSKMEGRINKKILNLYNKYGQFRLENEEIMKENNQRKKKKRKNISEDQTDGFYFGQYYRVNNEREGRGVCIFKDDTMYEGYWKEDSMTGPGRLINSNGEVYLGNFEDGKFNGDGTMVVEVGGTRKAYKGNWKNNKKDGQGHEQFEDGSWYAGNYKDGKFNGTGTFYQQDRSIYTGQFKDGSYNGQGTMEYFNKKVYEGAWANGERHGEGKTTYPNGEYYKGKYEYNKKHGEGEFKNANGIITQWVFRKDNRYFQRNENSLKKDNKSSTMSNSR